jgi:tetratricopeptide (TPR) repeat protein
VTDQELDEALARAVSEPDAQGLPALVALRDAARAERAPLDPALGRISDALVEVAGRSPDDLADYLRHAEDRARWLAAARGPAHPAAIKAWIDLGDAADQECAWDVATRAWEAVAGTPLDGADADTQAAISVALRGLGARRLAAGRLDEARVLFERDLVVTERLHPSPHAQLALSLGNLALVLERMGARAEALQLRERQRDVLVAGGAAAGLVASVEAQIAQLGGAPRV